MCLIPSRRIQLSYHLPSAYNHCNSSPWAPALTSRASCCWCNSLCEQLAYVLSGKHFWLRHCIHYEKQGWQLGGREKRRRKEQRAFQSSQPPPVTLLPPDTAALSYSPVDFQWMGWDEGGHCVMFDTEYHKVYFSTRITHCLFFICSMKYAPW